MNSWPKTESVLLRRIANPVDDAAWNRFDALYRPVVYRYARLNGLQHSDAEILVGEVMTRVFRAAQRWSRHQGAFDQAMDVVEGTPEATTGGDSDTRPKHFRAWLRRVAHNALLNLVTRQLARCGTGGTSHLRDLSQRPLPSDDAKRQWREEHQRQLFAAAAKKVQPQCNGDQWAVFWETHVEGVPIRDVAQQTGRSVGAIYAIRSRVIAQLRQSVARLEAFDDPDVSGESS